MSVCSRYPETLPRAVTRHRKSLIFPTCRLFQSESDPHAPVNFTRLQHVGFTSGLSPTRARDPLPVPPPVARAWAYAHYPHSLPAPVDCATSPLLTVDKKFNQVHYDLFSHPDSIFTVYFLIRNLDMPGDEISHPIHVIFYGDNFAQWS